MLIAIDIGNTNIVIGVYKKEHLKDSFRIATTHSMTSDEAGFFITGLLRDMSIANEEIDEVVIGSVVPPLTSVFETTARKHFGCIPLIVSSKIKLPIEIAIPDPDQLGADRIANSVAAYSRFGGPVIIVDFGTSTNFDIVNDQGAFIGGILCPGPLTSMEDLARKAARLFEIRIEPPDAVVGRSTAEALKSGLFYGTIGQVDFIIDKVLEETKFKNPKIIGTGGFAGAIKDYSRHITLIEPNLTLEGLKLIAEFEV